MDKVQKPRNPESDPFRIYMAESLDMNDSEQHSLVSDSDNYMDDMHQQIH
jgi:hypothetical protein